MRVRHALARLYQHQYQHPNTSHLPMAAASALAQRHGGGARFAATMTTTTTPRASAAAATPTAPAAALADVPPARRGQSLALVDTPALLVDLDAVERNAARLRSELEAMGSSVKVRPHFKAHKTPQLAALTLRALGGPSLAPGVCAQKLGEAEALVWSGIEGIDDVCITNEVSPTPGKMRRLAALARHPSRPRLSVVVDSAFALRALAEEVGRQAAAEAEMAAAEETRLPPHPIGVLVELNVGQDRCGADSTAEAADLAALVVELSQRQQQNQASSPLPLLEFRGIQGYHGGIQHVRRASERRDAAARAAELTAEAVAAVEARGLKVSVVTGGGTGTCLFDAAPGGVFTEVQPGSLFFGDADYARNEPSSSSASSAGAAQEPWERRWRQAAWVATTVMSRSELRGVAVVDAGLKAVALDSGPPRVLLNGAGGGEEEGGGVGGGLAPEFRNGGDEHGVLLFPRAGTVPPGASPPVPPVGELLRLLPGHCDPQWNLFDWVVAFRGGGKGDGGGAQWLDLPVEAVWRISARGPGT